MAIENNIEVPRVHVNVKDVEWTASPQYPEELRRVYRYKALIGGDWPRVIPQQDIIMGILELAPGAIYSAHAHPAPELYYVMSGSARWTVNEDTFDAEPGTAIYHAPDALHRMINTGDEPLRVCWMWWAPDGNREVLNIGSRLLEPVPEQPEIAKFYD